MSFAALDQEAKSRGLSILGGLPTPAAQDWAPKGGTLLLLGPEEPGYWPLFQAAPEQADGAPHPLDRWSKRVIGAWAAARGGAARFPSDGPPYAPFADWALASGTTFSSPIKLLVHARAGLWVSFRGVLALPEAMALPPAPPSPCKTCTAPCTSACPVGALSAEGYDLAACHAHLATPEGDDCMAGGCLARQTCPVSQGFGRLPAQAAFHMRAFHPGGRA